jgi:hypothetical protein
VTEASDLKLRSKHFPARSGIKSLCVKAEALKHLPAGSSIKSLCVKAEVIKASVLKQR